MICGLPALNQSYISSHNHRQWKRRSADVGGLFLATANAGQGKGWVGDEVGTQYAELLSDMYNQTLNAVNEHSGEYIPTSLRNPTRSRLIRSLDCWHFEPHKLPEEEILACTMILFEALYRIEGMEEAVGVPLKQVCAFVHHLRQIYRYENHYHNFEHALDVLQATQCYLTTAYMVPPVTILLEPRKMWKSSRRPTDGSLIQTLGLRDIFALYIAAIGHDVGHPGVTNVFMKNAQTPLSLVFDGRSALENLHCQLLLRVMRHHGLGVLLDDPAEGPRFRKLLLQTVLATDMSVHGDFMGRFQQETGGHQESLFQRQILACQAILKNADISNPSRPFPVAQHWAAALMEEWKAQNDLEDHFCLEQSVKPSADPLGVAKSQIFFISNFAKPLLDLSVQAVPEMARYAQHCDMNLDRWKMRESDLECRNARSPCPASNPLSPPPRSPRQPSDFQSAFPLTLPTGSCSSFLATPSTTVSIANSTASSESDPQSPCESVASSAVFSPASETPGPAPPLLSLSTATNGTSPASVNGGGPRRQHTPSSSSGSSVASGSTRMTQATSPVSVAASSVVSQDNEAIRAAGRLSMRQLKKSTHRNSWCVTSTMVMPPPEGRAASGLLPRPAGVGLGLGPIDTSAGKSISIPGKDGQVFGEPSPLSTVLSASPSPPLSTPTTMFPPPVSAPSVLFTGVNGGGYKLETPQQPQQLPSPAYSPTATLPSPISIPGGTETSPLLNGSAASQQGFVNAVPT